MDDGDGTFKATFGGINYVGVRNLLGSGLELRKAGGDHLGNVALLVALGNGDGFVKLAVLEAPATCCTKTRDCLRAALYIRARSNITPKE